jgi:hypothetical protein
MQHLRALTVQQETKRPQKVLRYVKIARARRTVARPQQPATCALRITTTPSTEIKTCVVQALRAANARAELLALQTVSRLKKGFTLPEAIGGLMLSRIMSKHAHGQRPALVG